MRNLTLPGVNDRAYFLKIAKAKQAPSRLLLLRIRRSVNSRYKEYIRCASRLESLPSSSMSKAEAAALVNCYSSKTKHLKTLRGELLYPDIEDFSECPLCGIGEPDTLDHYLPKDEFPEFSILSKNLIPVCGPCNSSYKGLKWLDKGKRIFIHTYYDIFPSFCFYKATIVVGSKVSIGFDLIRYAADPDFSDLFERHFVKLKLSMRYKRKASSEVSRRRRALELIYRKSGLGADVARSLKVEADRLKASYPQNHWKPLLYEALASSKDFCDGGFRKQIAM